MNSVLVVAIIGFVIFGAYFVARFYRDQLDFSLERSIRSFKEGLLRLQETASDISSPNLRKTSANDHFSKFPSTQANSIANLRTVKEISREAAWPYQATESEKMYERRRLVVLVITVGFFLSIVLSFIPGLGGMLILTVIFAVLFAIYVALISHVKNIESEKTRKLYVLSNQMTVSKDLKPRSSVVIIGKTSQIAK